MAGIQSLLWGTGLFIQNFFNLTRKTLPWKPFQFLPVKSIIVFRSHLLLISNPISNFPLPNLFFLFSASCFTTVKRDSQSQMKGNCYVRQGGIFTVPQVQRRNLILLQWPLGTTGISSFHHHHRVIQACLFSSVSSHLFV